MKKTRMLFQAILLMPAISGFSQSKDSLTVAAIIKEATVGDLCAVEDTEKGMNYEKH